jgi:hypothetical protein
MAEDGRTDGASHAPSHKKPRFKGDCGVVSAAMRDVPQKPTIRPRVKACSHLRYGSATRRNAQSAVPVVRRQVSRGRPDLAAARDVDTYNEPFAGSLAVLLGRPHAPRVETVNDLDCYLANFWRALQADPGGGRVLRRLPGERDGPARAASMVAGEESPSSRWSDEGGPGVLRREDCRLVGVGAVLVDRSGWCQRPEWTGRGVGAAANRGVHAPGLTKR